MSQEERDHRIPWRCNRKSIRHRSVGIWPQSCCPLFGQATHACAIIFSPLPTVTPPNSIFCCHGRTLVVVDSEHYWHGLGTSPRATSQDKTPHSFKRQSVGGVESRYHKKTLLHSIARVGSSDLERDVTLWHRARAGTRGGLVL